MLTDFNAFGLYANPMSDKESIHPQIENANAFTKVMSDDLVDAFNNQSLTKISAIARTNYTIQKI